MPLVLRIDRYCVFFWANEGEPLEPVHVHVSEGNPVPHATKIWLLASGHCRLCSNGSRIPEPALRNIMRVLEAYHEEIVEKWVACFRSICFVSEFAVTFGVGGSSIRSHKWLKYWLALGSDFR